MEMRLSSSQGQQFDLSIIHNNETLTFFVSPYLKLNKELTEDEIFSEINGFFARLPEDRQTAIFEIYRFIHTEYTDESVANPMYGERDATREKLIKCVAKLYQLIPYDELDYWVKFKSDIRFPSNLNENYGPDDPRERTYLRDEYIELVVLTVAIRAMVPIFALYINAFATESGSAFKEYDAFRLLGKSWLPESKPMQRLLLFLEHSIEKEHESHSAVLFGLSGPELPRWLLSLAVIVRLTVARISSTGNPGSESSIVSNIYFYIVKNILKSMDRKFQGKVQDKIKPRETIGGDQDKSSIVDQYKTKQEVSEGIIAYIKAYLENTELSAKRIAPDISSELIRDSVNLMMARSGMSFTKFHMVLTCWILSDAVAPRGIESLHLEKTLLCAYGTALAVLTHWGHYELASMLLCRVESIKDELMLSEARQRLSREITDELVVLAPYYQRGTGVKATMDPEKLKRSNNAVVQDINLITKDCMSVLWFMESDVQAYISRYAPHGHPVYELVDHKRRLSIPGNIKDLLGSLAIRCMSGH